MTVPIHERYFDDYLDNEVIEFGDYEVTEAEIIEFARKYDPQPFHLDHDAAAQSHFGGLVASGWLTGSIMMRLLVDGFVSQTSSMGSPGLDNLRWLKPVRPGDRLRVRATILSKRRSKSKPDRGIINVRWEVLNQGNEAVMTTQGMGMYKVRNPPVS